MTVATVGLKQALEELIHTVQDDPKAGQLELESSTRWVERLVCEAQVRDFPTIRVDEPELLGGTNTGPNPVELLLAAFGTCQEIMYAAYAAVMGVKLDAVEIKLKGNIDVRGLLGLDDAIFPGYSSISYETHLTSPEPEERLVEFQRVVEAHCPMLDMIKRPVEVHGSLVIERN